MTTETIAEWLGQIKDTHRRRVRLSTETIDFLIEQAERVRELETINLGQQVVIQSLRNKSTVKIIKERNNRATVIEWNDERYVYQSDTTARGGVRRGKQPHKGQAYKET